MKKTITLQKEFEALIEELEKLKSINEITTENSTSAKNTIDEMKSFIQAINKFKKTVISDHDEKKKSFQKLEKDLKESVTALNTETKKSVTTYSSRQEQFNKRMDKVVSNLSEKIEKELQAFQNEIKTEFKTDQDSLANQISELNKEIRTNQKQNKRQLLIASAVILVFLVIILIWK